MMEPQESSTVRDIKYSSKEQMEARWTEILLGLPIKYKWIVIYLIVSFGIHQLERSISGSMSMRSCLREKIVSGYMNHMLGCVKKVAEYQPTENTPTTSYQG